MKIRFILFAVSALLFSACTATGAPQPVETALPTSVVEPTATQSPVQAEASSTPENMPAMTTYTDKIAGFSLDYPSNWFINDTAAAGAEQSSVYSVGIATWDIRNPLPPSGKKENDIPEGGTKIDVGVVKQTMTLAEAVAQQVQNESGSPILARKDVTLANGLPAAILDMEGPTGLVRTLIAVLNGNVIYVSGYGNLEPFETIALSLRAN